MPVVTHPARDALAARLRAAGSVFAEDEADLLLEAGDGEPVRLRALVQRRLAGEPLEYVLGWAAFDGHRIRVTPGVFVPRSRTTVVVEQAALRLQRYDRVVDLCCGAGAISVALFGRVGALDLLATDIDPDAVDVAAENIGDRGIVVAGDLFAPLPERFRGAVAVIAVNAPYVPTASIALMPTEAREHEHRIALDGGADGLDLHRRIAASAGEWLRPGGAVVIEVSEAQAEASAAAFAAAGFTTAVERDAEVDGTCIVATLPA
ncbi:SAM-dependent methyltransferase [Curtobacterium sp. MCBA15_007]|nr:SAM-dependent methyltransferase [Curtobacterium flaccumfaciens]OII04858.1 SAM-dependent methyltransferase [Curtobacterium sp. MCBA15_007]